MTAVPDVGIGEELTPLPFLRAPFWGLSQAAFLPSRRLGFLEDSLGGHLERNTSAFSALAQMSTLTALGTCILRTEPPWLVRPMQ